MVDIPTLCGLIHQCVQQVSSSRYNSFTYKSIAINFGSHLEQDVLQPASSILSPDEVLVGSCKAQSQVLFNILKDGEHQRSHKADFCLEVIFHVRE